VFDIVLEGTTLLDDFDPFATGGCALGSGRDITASEVLSAP
jgi:hypothetical protein